MSKENKVLRILFVLVAAGGVVGCDRLSKQVATETLAGEPTRSYFFDMLRLNYMENTGSFLSLGAQLPEVVRFNLFVVGVAAILVGLVVYAFLHRWTGPRLFGLAIFVAGGASNWIDRLTSGGVVDFLNVGVGPVRTGIFNVADIAIMAGLVLLVFGDYSRSRRQVDDGQQ